MKKMLDVFRGILMLAGIALLVEATLAVRDMRRQELAAASALSGLSAKFSIALDSVHSIETNTTRTEAELSGFMNAQRHATADQKKAEDDLDALLLDLRKQVDAGGAEYADTLASIRFGVSQDSSAAVSSVQQMTKDMADLTKHADAAIDEASGSLSEAADAVKAQAASPAISEALASTAQSAKNIEATTADVKNVADYEMKQIEKPASFFARAAKFVAGIIGNLFHL